MSILQEQKLLLAIFEFRRCTLACPTCAEVGSLQGIEPSPTSLTSARCNSCNSTATMGKVQVTLTTAPVPAKATPKTTSDEVEKIRAELRTVRTALQQKTALYEQLFAKMLQEGKTKERATLTFPHCRLISPHCVPTEKKRMPATRKGSKRVNPPRRRTKSPFKARPFPLPPPAPSSPPQLRGQQRPRPTCQPKPSHPPHVNWRLASASSKKSPDLVASPTFTSTETAGCHAPRPAPVSAVSA